MNETALTNHYHQLYTESVAKIRARGVLTDESLDDPEDDRRGITLLIRPGEEVKERFRGWLEKLQRIEPGQYFYPVSDMHITFLSVISCYSGFETGKINLSAYHQLIHEALAGEKSFLVRMQGITASPSGVMIQGFSENDRLNELREILRKQFRKSALQQSIDQRYVLQTAHSTVVRFRRALQHKEAFLDKLEEYRDFDFGTFRVKEIELVTNDWYLRKEKVSTLRRFPLG
jgi:2'-5' RNA ligase